MKALKDIPFLRYRHAAEEAIAALPALIATAEKAASGVMHGGHARRKAGAGEKFWQFRDYAPTDRPQDIDWRQSARGDRLFVREKEWQTAQNVFFWCQNNDAMDYRSRNDLPKKGEAGIILCLALGLLLTRAGERVTALEGGALPGRSEKAIRLLGEQLLTKRTADLPAAAGNIPTRHAGLILAGDFLAPAEEIEDQFSRLAATTGSATIFQILDPAELAFPFEGRLTLSCGDSGKETYPVENAVGIRAAYREKLKDHLAFVRDCSRRHGWHWLLHTTDEDIRNTLGNAWGTMELPFLSERGGQ